MAATLASLKRVAAQCGQSAGESRDASSSLRPEAPSLDPGATWLPQKPVAEEPDAAEAPAAADEGGTPTPKNEPEEAERTAVAADPVTEAAFVLQPFAHGIWQQGQESDEQPWLAEEACPDEEATPAEEAPAEEAELAEG